jgi:ATP-dependent DNA ligase
VSQFYDLLYCRRAACLPPSTCYGSMPDFRGIPLIERKPRLRGLIRSGPDLLCVSHIDGRGTALLREFCRLDLAGIVAKYKHAPYVLESSWLKMQESQLFANDRTGRAF